jgi:hypothetical protein
MKKTAYRFYEQAAVVAVTMIFIAGAFGPVIGLQTKNSISQDFSENPETATVPIQTSQKETTTKDIDSNIAPMTDKFSPGKVQNPQLHRYTRHPLPLFTDDLWWNTQWQYRKKVTIDHTKVDGDLTHFPVLISLTADINLSAHAQSDGDDIVFTDTLGNQLSHQIELYINSTGQLIAWVNVTTLSSTQDTTLYMYYGNPICGSQQHAGGVWDSDYVLVYHLNETSGLHKDSTRYHNNASGVQCDHTRLCCGEN